MTDDRATRQKKQIAYAESILYNAILKGGIEEALKVRDELESILYAAMVNAQMSTLLSSEVGELSKEESAVVDKSKVIKSIFAGASEPVIDTLTVMAEFDDMHLCSAIYDTYNDLLEKHFDVIVVDVVTAVELDDHLRDIIRKKAQNELDANIVLHEHIDKDILGGVILSARHRIIDCSLLTMMERAKKELTSVHHYG